MANLSTLNVLFVSRAHKDCKKHVERLYARVTVEGKRIEMSLSYEVPTGLFNPRTQRCGGNSKEARSVNDFISVVKGEIHEIRKQLMLEGKAVTAERIRAIYKGEPDPDEIPVPTLLELYDEHNRKFKELIGTNNYSESTYKRHLTSRAHTFNFISKVYGKDDLKFEMVNYKFLKDYEHYLKAVRKCIHNSTMKYIKNLGKVINMAYAEGYLERNPFEKFKLTYETVERDVLTQQEIDRIIEADFPEKRLARVRDMFVFCIHTGIAYGDVKALCMHHLYVDAEGTRWVKNRRLKTNNEFLVPIMPIAQEIINKYNNHPQRINRDSVIPEISNQNYNGYLKEVAVRCGISKNLTSHLARHTFATTIALDNGVPLETLSKMLGHSSTKTTQIYAKVREKSIKLGMAKLLKKGEK